MRTKFLRLITAFRAVVLFMAIGFVGITKGYAYDFSAVCETGQTLYYNINGNNVTLTNPSSSGWSGYIMPTGTLVIPDNVTYNDVIYTVTSIKLQAFRGCSDLTSVIIPNSVQTINEHAFYECSGLQEITIGEGVTSIGQYAFTECP